MGKIIEANQYRPYELMKHSFFHKQQAMDLLQIAHKNQPHLSIEEIIKMLHISSEHGCSGATLANIIGKQFYKNDEEFKGMFGFSLYMKGTDTLDYNKILVDLYSRFYNIFKARFTEYEEYEFESIREAAFQLLGEKTKTNEEATIALNHNSIYLNGYSENGKLLFINKIPKISTYFGTCENITEAKFGIPSVHNIETLQNICIQNQIKFECLDLQISEKLSGLTYDHFNFWVDYYFASHQIPFTLQIKKIEKWNYGNTYEDFQNYINRLIANEQSITVSAGPNSQTYMRKLTKKKFSWEEISTEKRGHQMNFKQFNTEGNIIVASYGEEYMIPKELYKILIFDCIYKQEKERTNHKEDSPKKI